jgi:hypothetical protein
MPYCSVTEASEIGAYDAKLASLRLLKSQTDERMSTDPQISHVRQRDFETAPTALSIRSATSLGRET